ncbi:hypothetical protein VTK73DRAFT_10185 [Phialemonium thermophilum]|uniref:Uncharacterized protein n=1 Tax=Phialemonium thermophilum TaxID=223376 RepID=A0ABR3XH45_9PEZI
MIWQAYNSAPLQRKDAFYACSGAASSAQIADAQQTHWASPTRLRWCRSFIRLLSHHVVLQALLIEEGIGKKDTLGETTLSGDCVDLTQSAYSVKQIKTFRCQTGKINWASSCRRAIVEGSFWPSGQFLNLAPLSELSPLIDSPLTERKASGSMAGNITLDLGSCGASNSRGL